MASPRNATRIPSTGLRAAGIACVAALALSACSSKPALPSNFEVIGKTSTDAGDIYTVRDIGTGCEFISGDTGLLPRNERSADGTAVKQRCVITGDETPAPANVQQFDQGSTTTTGATQPAFAAQEAPPSSAAQEQAVREAIREQTAGAIPPAAAPSIPPPRGARRATQPATPAQQPQDGVESQMK